MTQIANDGLRLAGLFSNAGIALMRGDLSCEGCPVETQERVMEVNHFGAVRIVQTLLPTIREHRARVIFNSALMTRVVMPFNAGYAPAKMALEGVRRLASTRSPSVRCARHDHPRRGGELGPRVETRCREGPDRHSVSRPAADDGDVLVDAGETRRLACDVATPIRREGRLRAPGASTPDQDDRRWWRDPGLGDGRAARSSSGCADRNRSEAGLASGQIERPVISSLSTRTH